MIKLKNNYIKYISQQTFAAYGKRYRFISKILRIIRVKESIWDTSPTNYQARIYWVCNQTIIWKASQKDEIQIKEKLNRGRIS